MQENIIGGTDPGKGNIIANNGFVGGLAEGLGNGIALVKYPLNSTVGC